jgi:hypothetical protein
MRTSLDWEIRRDEKCLSVGSWPMIPIVIASVRITEAVG